MLFHNINLLAVLVCAVSSFIIGGLWYSLIFNKMWLKAMGKTKEDFKDAKPGLPMLLSFVASIIMAFILAHILNLSFSVGHALTPDMQMAIETAGGCWVAFTLMPTFVTRNFEATSYNLFLIGTAYRLVDFVVMAIILTLWR
jgi:uncharacterized protein DUF1761